LNHTQTFVLVMLTLGGIFFISKIVRLSSCIEDIEKNITFVANNKEHSTTSAIQHAERKKETSMLVLVKGRAQAQRQEQRNCESLIFCGARRR